MHFSLSPLLNESSYSLNLVSGGKETKPYQMPNSPEGIHGKKHFTISYPLQSIRWNNIDSLLVQFICDYNTSNETQGRQSMQRWKEREEKRGTPCFEGSEGAVSSKRNVFTTDTYFLQRAVTSLPGIISTHHYSRSNPALISPDVSVESCLLTCTHGLCLVHCSPHKS